MRTSFIMRFYKKIAKCLEQSGISWPGMKPPRKPDKPQSKETKPNVEQSGIPAAQTSQPQAKRKNLRISQILIIIGGLTATFLLGKGWWNQSHSPLVCENEFGPLAGNNGYIQIDILAPHQIEQDFNAELFLLYAANESPPTAMRLIRGANGGYASSVLETQLVPWGTGRATPKPVPFDIPTPGVSLRNFPFDSRNFDFSLQFAPAQRPKVVIIRNLTNDFIPTCNTLSSKWDGDKLNISVVFRRNPFVQTTAIIVSLAALAFGWLLGRLKNHEDLARAAASYFFSLWSVRALVTPSGLAYSSFLDFWFMAVAVFVLFVVAWRFAAPRTPVSRT